MEWIQGSDVSVAYVSPAQMPFYGNRDVVSLCVVDNTCIMPYLSNYAPVVSDGAHRKYQGIVVSGGRVYLTGIVSNLKRAIKQTEKLYYSVLEIICS